MRSSDALPSPEMRSQVFTIIWAQWRTVRNHLPRLGFASIVGNILSCLWYTLVLSAGIGLAYALPFIPGDTLRHALPSALLALFAAWQIIPLFTLSTGWSLQLKKLQIYPVRTGALFGIEVLLRITATPELVIVLLGGTIGLLRHPALPTFTPAAALLLLPLSLLLSLAVREMVLHSFERNRFREIFAIVMVSIAILPQLLLRTANYERVGGILEQFGSLPLAPWTILANLVLHRANFLECLALLIYLALAYGLARFFFARSLRIEDSPQSDRATATSSRISQDSGPNLITRLLGDPTAALVQKELQSLARMPRFRVAFGMACVFSVLILFPLLRRTATSEHFSERNFLPFVSLYGLLILSDSLILNIFGTDRSAAALYLLAPVPLKTVLRAKNITAVLFIAIQSCLTMLGGSLLRRPHDPTDVLAAVALVAVTGLFFLCVGNYTSILIPRPSDPRQTMRKAAGGKLQLWLLLCMLGVAILGGLAYLAEWAVGSRWALLAVLALEFCIGLVVYHVALDSATAHGLRDREKFVDALSRGPSVVGSSD
jgi:ABC-2 type transport system permease protein